METLFKALPTALQWEILCVFVGSHVVRNNRLKRRFTGKIQKQILDNTIKYSEYRKNQTFLPIFHEEKIPWLVKYKIVTMIHFSEGGKRILLENKETAKMSYWYICSDRWVVLHLEDDLILTPFIKHNYPSWESTDKKKGTVWQKVVLYDPRKSNPNYFGLGSDTW